VDNPAVGYGFCIRAKRITKNKIRIPVRIVIVVAYCLRNISSSQTMAQTKLKRSE
jgi:hypothetical protein